MPQNIPLKLPAVVWNGRYKAHAVPKQHPESSHRVDVILEALKKNKLLSEENGVCVWRKYSHGLRLCHSKAYVELVEKACASLNKGEVAFLPTGDVTIVRESFSVAQDAVSSVCLGIDLVMQGDFPSAFVVVRPPGHHAESEKGMGFCLFNNVAIGARYAQHAWGKSRVAIIDWDLHHGNGTEEIFLKDPSILYVSTHQRGIYPGTGQEEVRGKKGEHIINIPIEGGPSSRSALLDFYLNELPERLLEFKPELILISCGFDAHKLDPLGGFTLESEDYGEMTRALVKISASLSNCPIVSVLEGGYNLDALRESSVAHVLGFMH